MNIKEQIANTQDTIDELFYWLQHFIYWNS